MEGYIVAAVGVVCAIVGCIYIRDISYLQKELQLLRTEVSSLSTLIAENQIDILERKLVDSGSCKEICDEFQKRINDLERTVAILEAKMPNSKGTHNA